MIDDEARRRIQSFIDKGKEEARLAFAADLGTVYAEASAPR